MGSKMPPPRKSAESQGQEDESSARFALPSSEAKSRLVGRIASALQVPQGMLYDSHLPAARETAGGVAVADLDTECLAMLQAFRRIQDAEERRRLLVLVQEAGDRS